MVAGPKFGSKQNSFQSARVESRQGTARRQAPRRPPDSRSSSRKFGFLVLAVILAAAALPFLTAARSAPEIISYFVPENGARQPAAERVERRFTICGREKRINCVVDGDTFWLDGEKIRIADINTPEISSPSCAAEAHLGKKATTRLQALLNGGAFELQRGDRDKDVYGRQLRTVHRDGRSIGEILIADGLAHEWRGRKESWCG